MYMVQVQEFHMTITDLHHMVLEEVNHILTQCDGEILGPGHVTRYPSVVMVNIHPTNQVSRSHDWNFYSYQNMVILKIFIFHGFYFLHLQYFPTHSEISLIDKAKIQHY